jgi:anti-sigma factor RsiW
MDHVEEKIQTCIDGELAPAEAEAVRAHCRACERCGRVWAQIEAVHHALDAAGPIEESPSIWPLIAARLHGAPSALRGVPSPLRGAPSPLRGAPSRPRAVPWRPSGRRPLLQPAFALGAAVAIAAGLAIGLVVGPRPTESVAASGSGTVDRTDSEFLTEGSLPADGSLLVDGVATTLDEVYLAATYDSE